MTKEERELFLNFVDGKRKYNRTKNLVVKRFQSQKEDIKTLSMFIQCVD